MARTRINGGWVVGFNGKEHRIIRNGVVVYENDRIVHVGFGYDGPADEVIDATGQIVVPGFINMHLHAGHAGQGRIISDHGRPEFFGAGYLNYSSPKKERLGQTPRHADPELAARITLADLARFGTTTMVEIGAPLAVQEELVRQSVDIPLRCYLGPGYRTGEHYTDSRGVLQYDWDEERGFKGLEQAIKFIEKYDGAHQGRIRGTLMPMQVDTCSEKLIRRTVEVSESMQVPRQIHTAQNLQEFHQCLRCYGMTPVQFLDYCGFLGPRASLGHAVFTDVHPWTHYQGEDFRRIVETGTSTTTSPLAMMRRGIPMYSFSRYLRAGVNICIGTDTYPRDIIAEMRFASLNCKILEGNVTMGTAREVFNAATLNGARALGRDDLGRLAPGAKADIVIIDPRNLRWGPIYDPIKSLVDCGTGDDVRWVIVDGKIVVRDGRIPGLDEDELLAACQAEADAWYAAYQEDDWSGRAVDEAFPPAFPEASPGEFPSA